MLAAALLACAVNIAPVTLNAVVRVESGGDPLAIRVNHLSGPQPPHPATAAQAAALAELFIARGYSVDLGLMQVNSRHLAAFGLTVQQALDPCTNIRAGDAVLTADYLAAARAVGPGQRALRLALAMYNAGSFRGGVANGYVGHYYRRGGVANLAPLVIQAAPK
ncbi:MAG TPA: lytic transglycosylase domain-containing protein [Acetobacteraceae bacterium]|nr:lytic transglycosylase domain-containing protein [Acetobacteraceae bacterium]